MAKPKVRRIDQAPIDVKALDAEILLLEQETMNNCAALVAALNAPDISEDEIWRLRHELAKVAKMTSWVNVNTRKELSETSPRLTEFCRKAAKALINPNISAERKRKYTVLLQQVVGELQALANR